MRAATAAPGEGRRCLLWAALEGDPSTLDFNGFGDGESILQFDAQIPNRAIHLGVSEKELNGSKVSGLLVDLSDFCPPHRMRAVGAGFQTY